MTGIHPWLEIFQVKDLFSRTLKILFQTLLPNQLPCRSSSPMHEKSRIRFFDIKCWYMSFDISTPFISYCRFHYCKPFVRTPRKATRNNTNSTKIEILSYFNHYISFIACVASFFLCYKIVYAMIACQIIKPHQQFSKQDI